MASLDELTVAVATLMNSVDALEKSAYFSDIRTDAETDLHTIIQENHDDVHKLLISHRDRLANLERCVTDLHKEVMLLKAVDRITRLPKPVETPAVPAKKELKDYTEADILADIQEGMKDPIAMKQALSTMLAAIKDPSKTITLMTSPDGRRLAVQGELKTSTPPLFKSEDVKVALEAKVEEEVKKMEAEDKKCEVTTLSAKGRALCGKVVPIDVTGKDKRAMCTFHRMICPIETWTASMGDQAKCIDV